MGSPLNDFLSGITVCSCWGAAVFFLRYWRDTRDRLFLLFAIGLFVLSLNWVALEIVRPVAETRHYFYVIRLIAFGCMVAGIWDKNRGR
ncbi:MAG TPA: DUF5985 family protein [Vicinamibacterales bacterium]|nr:DUF5985 family protein [Vicinamibacterales bacterium]